MSTGNRYTMDTVRRVVALYHDEKRPSTQVSEVTGVCRTTVIRWVKRAGVYRTKRQAEQLRRRQENESKWRRMAAFYDAGYSYDDVAGIFDCSVQPVMNAVHRYSEPRSLVEAQAVRHGAEIRRAA